VKINGKTKVYGILGNPVSHSLSPVMHNEAFDKLGLNCAYLPFQVHNVEEAIDGLRGLNIQGVSVTIPHKEAVITYLDEIDSVAQKIGSVNTIARRSDDGSEKLIGYNTDWIGANRALESEMELKGAKVVMLGAGGSARAIGFGLLEAGALLTLCSRTESRGRKLAAELGCGWVSLDESTGLQGDALINATSVGMAPGSDKSPVSANTVESFSVVMDIVYAPLKTRLLADAEKSGCRIVNGLEMLLFQGVAQFELWTGCRAPVEQMRSSLLFATGNDG